MGLRPPQEPKVPALEPTNMNKMSDVTLVLGEKLGMKKDPNMLAMNLGA